MAAAVKKLDVSIGDVVEIGDRRYDVVSDKAGGVTLEAAITTTAAEMNERDGARALTPEEFDAAFGELPADGQG